MNILNVIKGFIGTHKLASIITASVVGVGAIGGTTVGVIHAVNNNKDDDTKVEAITNVNTTDMTATALEGQEINPADLQDVTEEVQADGTSVIKDKNGTVVAKKDASGKTTLTKDGGVALSTGSVQASGDLASNVSNAQAQTQSYVASMPANNNNASYTASTPSSTPSPAPSNNYVAPSTPAHTHTWQTVEPKYKTVHHDAVYSDWDEEIKEPRDIMKCNHCDYWIFEDEANSHGKMAEHFHTMHSELGQGSYTATGKMVTVNTIHHHDLVQPAYDEQVLVENGYTYCTGCGARQ